MVLDRAPVVVEVANGAMLDTEPLRDLFTRAFHGEHFPEGDEALAWVRQRFDEDEVALLVALGGGEMVGLTILTAWTSAFDPFPWIVHFYAESRATKRVLGEAAKAWFRDRGYDRAGALNRSAVSDDAWVRLFEPVAPVERFGTVFSFDLTE